MTTMEEYFPFVTKAYDIMQYTAWAVLFLVVTWQLFRSFGGPLTEAENPWQLTIRGALFALLIAYAKPIFNLTLQIARAPYLSLMEISMTGEDFTFAGLEEALTNGLTTIISAASIVGLILILILEISLGWNYFKLLLETVERYVVVGVMCYTSPLAFSMGGSKATGNVFKSWCRMVGSQLLLLVMNVWFLRGFSSSVGQFIGNGGALTSGKGSIFLWMFCALAYLKCAQRFDSYLGSLGLNVAQTGSSMGMELLMAARVMTGFGGGPKSAGSVFGRNGGTPTSPGGAAAGFAAGFASKFSPNSYVRDAVVEGGTRMGMSGGAGFVARAFGGMAARNGAVLNGTSISSVASRNSAYSGTIAGGIADRSLANYMPQFAGYQLTGTKITGGMISTLATDSEGRASSVDLFNAAQFEKPDIPHSVVTASDGSQWYQIASGEGKGAFYDAPIFRGTEGAAAAESAFTGASAAGAGDADRSSPQHESSGAEEHEDSAAENFSTTEYQPEFTPSAAADMDLSGFAGETVTASELGMVDRAESGFETDLAGEDSKSDYSDGDVSNGFHPEIASMPKADMDSAEISQATGLETAAEESEAPGYEAAFTDSSAGIGFHPEFTSAVDTDASGFTGTAAHYESGVTDAPDDSAYPGSTVDPGFHPEFVPTSEVDAVTPGFTGTAAHFEPGITDTPDDSAYPGSTADPGFHPEFVPASEVDAAAPGFTGTAAQFEPGMTDTHSDSAYPGSTADPGFHPEFVPASEVDAAAPGFTGSASQYESGVTDAHADSADFGGTPGPSFHPESIQTSAADSDMPRFSGTAPRFEPGVSESHEDSDYSEPVSGSRFHSGFASRAEADLVAATFPGAPDGTSLRTIGEGAIEASMPDGSNSMWYNSAFYEEPDAPHQVLQSANGVDWFTMQPNAEMPQFEAAGDDTPFNQTAFRNFMPGYQEKVSQFDQSEMADGCFKVRNEDGSGTAFYDATRFDAPRGAYKTFEDSRGSQWYAIRGEAAVERKPVFEKGKPVYDGEKLVTRNVDTVRYKQVPAKFKAPSKRSEFPKKQPRRKNK